MRGVTEAGPIIGGHQQTQEGRLLEVKQGDADWWVSGEGTRSCYSLAWMPKFYAY